jgi:ubiquinone/menaquinone biosynthesis C-methylase UbiE
MQKKRFINSFDEKFYPGFKNGWDNDFFRSLVLKYLDNTKTCLDIGAGRGALPQMAFKGVAKKVYGIDPSEAVMNNPYLDEANVGFGENMPYPDALFDLVYANNVLEHISNPEEFLAEVNRVLKTSGIFIAKTPNTNHYMPLFAKLLPEKLHDWYHKLKGRPSEDTFPAFYKMNSKSSLSQLANKTGFSIKEIRFVEGRPEYLRFHFLPYLLGIAYERTINRLKLDRFKVVIYIVFQKQ